ncbi:MAG: hypothetical protein RIG84_14960 [Roseovarius sp.]
MTTAPSRRALLGWIGLACLPATALHANDYEEEDPADLVSDRFSIRQFTSLSENEIYKVGLAIKRGRTIRIGDYSPSESKAIILRARENWPATRAELLSGG